MSINNDDSFDVGKDGIAIRNDDGDAVFYIASGIGDPTGNQAPVNSWYFRTDNRLIYYKFGTGVNDWRQIRADDIAFDSTLSQNLIASNIKDALVGLSNRHYGKDYSVATRETQLDVTGNSFSTYLNLNFTLNNEDSSNLYKYKCYFVWGHDSASNDIRVRAMLDGTQVGPEIRVEPKDAGVDQRISSEITGVFQNTISSARDLRIELRPATSNRVSRMYYAIIEVWRVS